MSQSALSNYTVYSRYAHYIPGEKRRENWGEIVDRVFGMHERRFCDLLNSNEEFRADFEFAKNYVLKKRVLGSQRTLQFGGKWVEDHELKIYNCLSTYADRPRVFQEIMYGLLCGCGVGYSVRNCHVNKLPKIQPIKESAIEWVFVIPDSIEGWSDAIGIIVNSYFEESDCWPDVCGKKIVFDYSKIRPKGSLIAGQFKAPGAEGLKTAVERIRSLLDRCVKTQEMLKPIDVSDIVCHASDAVLSGGVRRSSTLVLFSPEDVEMATAKTGDWFKTNPQRARSNNSAALVKNHTKKEKFEELIGSTKNYGEPGFVWVNCDEEVMNPCSEICMIPHYNGESGLQGCNLSEINGKYCDSEEKFLECCRAAAIIGTLQASYTKFKYLTPISQKIFERESLLGVSITGIMDNPEILLDPRIQKKGASIVLDTNERVANIIGINKAARATCVKPSGSASCVLQTASGVHPHHAKRYIRRVQANHMEFPAQLFTTKNPLAAETSVWGASGTDLVLSFLCEVPKGSILKNQMGAVEFLEKIRIFQRNWIEYGTRTECCINKDSRHSVSCTVIVKPDEWLDVEKFIFKYQKDFTGISLLPASGDLDYTQAPFSTVLSPDEIVREYGDASVFASGLIVDGLHAFDENLWKACDCVLGVGEEISDTFAEPHFPTKNGYTLKQHNAALIEYYLAKDEYDTWFAKRDWVRRCNQFAIRYFDGDKRRATYCLKHVSLWKTWCDLKREYVDIDWSTVIEENQHFIDADTLGATACNGGRCEIDI